MKVKQNKDIDINDTSINKEFYGDLVDKMTEMYNRAQTYGEVKLMGEILEFMNFKTEMKG